MSLTVPHLPVDELDPWEAMTAQVSKPRRRRKPSRNVRMASLSVAAVLLAGGGITTGATAASLHAARDKAGKALLQAGETHKVRQDGAKVLVGFLYNDPPLELEAMQAVLGDANQAEVNNPGSDGSGRKFTKYADAQLELNGSMRTLINAAAKHPALEANNDFTAARKQVTGNDSGIAAATEAYNEAAGRYNSARESFPANLIAPMLGHGEPFGTLTAP